MRTLRTSAVAAVAALALLFTAPAPAAEAWLTKYEAWQHLRGLCCSGNDDDIHRYGVNNGLAGFQGVPYFHREGDNDVWLMLDFVTWSGYKHTTCGYAYTGDAGRDFIVQGPWAYGCGGVYSWQVY